MTCQDIRTNKSHGRPKINWGEIVTGYNRIYGTDYLTIDNLLGDLYLTMGSRGIEGILGISYTSILSRLKDAGIEIKPKGGPNFKGIKKPQNIDIPGSEDYI